MVSAHVARHPASGTARARPDISVIIPVLNEIEGIDHCYSEVVRRLEQSPYSFELVFVDDGSTDGSTERLRELETGDERVTYLQMLPYVGLQHANLSGIRHAR